MKNPVIKYSLLILAFSVGVYANSLQGNFVSDDIPEILNNPRIGEISAIKDVVDLVNYICFKIAGLKPAAYHLFNIALHSFNSLLVFFLLMHFFPISESFWGALIFALHPVHTEAVSWISGKPYLLSTAFLLLSFLCYIKANSTQKLRLGPYLASVLFFLPSMVSNWYGFLFPLMIILYDLTYQNGRKNYKLWFGYIAPVMIWLIMKHHLLGQRVDFVQVQLSSTEMSNPLFNMAFSLFSHVKLVIWPVALTLYHEPLRISAQLLEVQLIGLVLLACLLPLCYKKAKPVFLAIGIFVLFLAPTYSPVLISWLVGERYLYLPVLSLCLLAAFSLQKCTHIFRIKTLAVGFLVLLTGFYAVRTILRNNDWRDRAALWRATARVSPESPKARNNMGDIYCNEGNYSKAIQEFKLATELRPDYADAYHNLAHTYQKVGKINAAIANYKEAIALNPRLSQSYLNLGILYLNRNELSLASAYLQKAQELNPDHQQLRKILNRLGK